MKSELASFNSNLKKEISTELEQLLFNIVFAK